MKIAVIGCGSMGGKHIKHLLELGNEVIPCDVNAERLNQVCNKYSVT